MSQLCSMRFDRLEAICVVHVNLSPPPLDPCVVVQNYFVFLSCLPSLVFVVCLGLGWFGFSSCE